MLVKKITPPLFQPYLIREKNRAFIEGRSNKFFITYSSGWILLLPLFMIPLSTIFFIFAMGSVYNSVYNKGIKVSSLISSTTQSDIDMLLSLLQFSFFMLIFVFILIISIYIARMYLIFKYRKNEIIQGTLISASAQEDIDNDLNVTFNYDFNTPDGCKITNSIIEICNDLKDKNLPPNGTQLAVLYINDKIYTLL